MKTVKELIEELKLLPQDLPVGVSVGNSDWIQHYMMPTDGPIIAVLGTAHYAGEPKESDMVFIGAGLPTHSGYKFTAR